jgi:hypothetical protein
MGVQGRVTAPCALIVEYGEGLNDRPGLALPRAYEVMDLGLQARLAAKANGKSALVHARSRTPPKRKDMNLK